MKVTLDAKKRALHLVEKSGKSVGFLADRIGVSYSTLWNFLHGQTRNFGKIQELADELRVSLYQLTTGNLENSNPHRTAFAEPNREDTVHSPGAKIPVYQAERADEAYILGGEAAEECVRLIGEGISKIFAIKVQGDNMAPRYKWGELVYCGHNIRPNPGDDCVVELEGQAGYLKIYAGESNGTYVFRQLNPAQEWRCGAKDVRALHAVIGRGR